MQSVYYLNTGELNLDFLQTIKMLFDNKNIQITINECIDETEYLMQSPANAKRLMQSVNNINNGKNLVEMDINQLKKMAYEKVDI